MTSSATEEQILWTGTSSQVKNLGFYILCGIFCFLIIPIFFAIWKWLQVSNRVYQITSQRIKITDGIFSKTNEGIELYRVKDIVIEQPFFQRLFKLETMTLKTSDQSCPELLLDFMKQDAKLGDLIRNNVEIQRDRKRVREVDFDDLQTS